MTNDVESLQSPLLFVSIACRTTYPPFNHRSATELFSRCFPSVEHSATECHVGVITACFQKTSEDISSVIPSLDLCTVPNHSLDILISRFTVTLLKLSPPLCCVDFPEMSASGDPRYQVGSSPFTALAVTTAIVIFTITSLITVFCIISGCTRYRQKKAQPLKPPPLPPRHLANEPETTTLASGTTYSRDIRPTSFYQSVCSDTVYPTMKSSWTSTSVPLSQLWSASQLGLKRAFPPSRQIQPITLHYYNDF